MKSDYLRDIYYKAPHKFEEEYNLRFNAPYTKHLNIDIQEINRKNSFPAFFQYTEEITRLLLDISKASHEISSVYEKISAFALKQFWYQSIIEEIKATNDIEGVRSTRKEIKEALADIINGGKAKRFDSVINKYLKIEQEKFASLKTSKDIRELYDFFILDEVIRENPSDAPDGKYFRKDPVSIVTPSLKEIHKGLNPESEIIKAMDYALEILNDNETPRLIAIAIFQYLFGYIHPFYNGNGRIARFIATYYLAQEIDKYCSLRLSISIKVKKKHYYEMFSKTNDEHSRGELTYFITEFLQLILDTIKSTREIIESKYLQLEKYNKILLDKLHSAGIEDKTTLKIYGVLLEAVLFAGGVTVEEIKEFVGVSRNTVDSRLAKMPREHYIKDCSNRVYRYRLNSLFLK